MSTTSSSTLVGWRECIALPDLGLPALRAKVDTGARSSALHVDAQWRTVEAGAPWVGFRLTPRGREAVEVHAPVHDEREVVDSGGHRSLRVFLRTRLRLAGVERMIEVNLADRRGMRFAMLVGRTALSGHFTVDPARSFLHGRAPRRPLPPTARP
ncbi:ATP-dependent zinc protease family protein [Cognatilysobacter segetis]|uniref:ATP-dependent zinc protease family protein n=1 Tax=Cognatilysobacter segetis TaxID=2492394 RepID=UPI00192E5417|nr:RimK/LysX family protein [Lysobacter segetis]